MPLFELPETEQEVFYIVKSHLLSQNRKCVAKGTCRYSHDGLKCAAGVLIPNEYYDPAFENMLWPGLIYLHDFPPQHSKLISFLQIIHDQENPVEWEDKLREVASYFSLKYERTTNV